MAVPYTFANATVSIPLSQLDSNFATAITLGNTAIQLGNTVTTLNNMTLANVTVSSGNATFTTANVTNMSSSNVTITGGTIANVTISGSGSNITATNINASNVTVSTDLTLSGGTANGVAYLNGSKVLTTGSLVTFDGSQTFKLTSTSGPLFAVSDNVTTFGYIGSQSAITGSGAIDTFIVTSANSKPLNLRAPSGQYISFDASGSEQMRLTSTGLGIGTSSPSYKLQVTQDGNLNATSAITNATAGTSSVARFLAISDAGNAAFGMTSSSYTDITGAADSLLIGAGNASGGMSFALDGVLKMKLDSSGNLGLGVTPSAWTTVVPAMELGSAGTFIAAQGSSAVLRVGSNAYYNGGWFYKVTGYSSRYDQASGAHTWYTAPSGTAGAAITFTQAMTLDASGQLILGTNPSTLWFGDTSTGGFVKGTNTGGYLILGSAGTERMRIDSSGNVGIGTSSPSVKLDVHAGDGNNAIGLNGWTVTKFTGTEVRWGGVNASQWQTATFYTGNTERMRIDSSGVVNIGYSTTSAWSGTNSLNLGRSGAIYGDGLSYDWCVGLTENLYRTNGSTFKYKASAIPAYLMQMSNGGGFNAGWNVYYAPSGTADATATLTKLLSVDYNYTLQLQGASTAAGGTGITFPATQNASSDANTLDDYEEGTFTPTYGVTGTFTYSRQFGKYTKVGNVVTICIDIALSSQSGGAGALYINTLPFPIASLSGVQTLMIFGDNNWPTPRSNLCGYQSGTTAIGVFYNSGNNLATVNVTDVGNSGRILVTGSYFTS